MRTDDVQAFFEDKSGGKIIDCRIMNGSCSIFILFSISSDLLGFGFIEFETPEVSPTYDASEKNPDKSQDAEQGVRLNGHDFQGQPLVVEFAKENRPRREPPRDMRSG